MTEIRRNYELAFHINPNLDETKIAEISNELKDQLTKNGNVVTFAQEPERKRLSYDVQGSGHAYFGYIQFNTDNPEGLAAVQEYIKLNPDILRTLVIRLPSDAKKNEAIMRQQKAREHMERAKATPKGAPAPVENKELDKEIEDIIEKL